MRRKNVLTILFVAIITLSITTFTYAFFQGGVNNVNQQTATVTAGTMELTFADNDQGIGAVMNFGDTITKKFTIENTGTVNAYAKISWLNMINTYLEGSLVYTLEYSDTEDGTYKKVISEKNVPRSEVTSTIELIDGLLVPAGVKRYYNLHITLVNSPTVDQTADLSATFNTLFTMESGTPTSEVTLAALGLADSVKEEPTDYNMFDMTYDGYRRNIVDGPLFKTDYVCVKNKIIVDSLLSTGATETTCQTVYYAYRFGYYDSSIEQLIIGDATWDDTTNQCIFNGEPVLSMEKIYDDNPLATKEECGVTYQLDAVYLTGIKKIGKGSFIQIEKTEGLYTMEDDFGTSYFFRGSKALNNIVKFGKYDTDMYYYPVFQTGVNGKKYLTGSLEQCQKETINIDYCKNDYKYANAGDDMYWRIVRINGDGTLRLMYIGTSATATGINSFAGKSNFNYPYNDKKYAGYTYDNSAPNVQDGTASDIKNYLDTWYSRSMSNEDSNIAISQFYSDTTGYGPNYLLDQLNEYSSTIRLSRQPRRLSRQPSFQVSPTLKTNLTTETYGGVYNLKVGLVNIDEIVLSGFDGIPNSNENSSPSYDETREYPFMVNRGHNSWSFSPHGFFENSDLTYLIDSNGNIAGSSTVYEYEVYPIINLSVTTAQQLIGSGSTIDPYRLG